MAEKSLEAHLFECLKKGNTKKALYIVRLMGRNVNKLYRGKSSLIWARKFENQDVIDALIEKGAEEEFICLETARELGVDLITALEKKKLDQAMELFEAGADVNAKNNSGDTPLMYASLAGNVELVKLFIEEGADVNARNRRGYTAIKRVVNNNHFEIAKILILNGYDVNLVDRLGDTALTTVCSCNWPEIVEMLVQRGADVNVKNKEGETALMIATKRGNKEVVEVLIEAGADVLCKDQKGKTVIDRAGDERMRKAIIDAVKKKYQKEPENNPLRGPEMGL